jgi:RHS repeat-associated protein
MLQHNECSGALSDNVGTIHDSAKFSSSTGTSAVIVHRYMNAFGDAGSYSTFDGQSYSGGPFIYTGRFRDDMTGLQWNLNRWYDASTGRWLSEDPIGFGGGDDNLYRYVGNSPLANTDPTGLAGTIDSPSVAVRKCLERPTYFEKIKCLQDLLGSGKPDLDSECDRVINILKCDSIHHSYKLLGCKGCEKVTTRKEAMANRNCLLLETAGRALYLRERCDYVLPGSIKRGSALAENGHRVQLHDKLKALATCELKARTLPR